MDLVIEIAEYLELINIEKLICKTKIASKYNNVERAAIFYNLSSKKILLFYTGNVEHYDLTEVYPSIRTYIYKMNGWNPNHIIL